MRLRLYRAASIADAISAVRADLGSEALILSTRRVGGGVELTAAVEPRHEPPPVPPAQPDIRQALEWHGVPQSLAARLACDDLPGALAGIFRFERLALDGGATLVVAGVPGAGKTLTIARLATRLVLAGHRPLVITADGKRAGAAEELAAYTRVLGLSLVVASHPLTLTRALQHRAEGAALLIDTAGASPYDPAQMESLAALAAIAQAPPVMVMAAGFDPREAEDHAARFAAIGARQMIATRFDLVRRLGSVVAAAASGDLALTEVSMGPTVTDGVGPLTAEVLAARLAQIPPDPLPLGDR
jgi:flagellar biosynthesis protein FlhF